MPGPAVAWRRGLLIRGLIFSVLSALSHPHACTYQSLQCMDTVSTDAFAEMSAARRWSYPVQEPDMTSDSSLQDAVDLRTSCELLLNVAKLH
jgi:hypothetical protein